MSTPILATKLFIPPPRPKVVSRPRLVERLNEGLHSKLTLIAAPAGFGKTTLVSEWLAAPLGAQRPVAWLSLDAGENDPTRFLAYLVAALQTIAPALGEGVLGLLASPQPPPTPALLAALLNEITTLPEPAVLVLDDYHVIDTQAVDQALTFLLERLPPQLHLVITTREDPPLPLARLRARGQLSEVRAAELRFTPAEAAEFLNQVMGLHLSAEEVAALETRTEGWIAGLQLAALSMRGREDMAGFVHAFAGDNRYIVDYLVEEVLQRQPEGVRSFLLQTSILDRLSGPLCDAVTGQENGGPRLQALERGNFFVVPLDDKRHWYRYHHLFADVLAAHLRAEQPDRIPALHRRASEWCAQNGLPVAAIRHALAAGDFERAATLVELAMPEMRRTRQEATLLGWLKALPDEVVRARPVLSVNYVGALLSNGEIEGVEARLRDAERWLEPSAEMRAVVVDEAAFRGLPGAIAIYRAGLALALGNAPAAATYARRALALIPEDDHLWHGAAAALLGLASWTGGDLEAAHRSYGEGMASLQRAGHISDVIGGAIALADIRIAQGRLAEAMRTYARGLQLATEHGDPAMRGTADMHVGMSELYREYGDLDAARQRLLRSQEQGEHTGFPQNPYRWRVAMARIRQAEGDLDAALDLLHEAERLYVSDFYPNVRPIAALATRVWVAQGRLGEALGWAHDRGLSAQDDLSYLREFEHITLARILLAQYQRDHTDSSLREATGLLERLLKAAEAGGRTRSVIEILVLQALAHQAQGDLPAALLPLARALTLAGGPMGAEGYVRMFVDEGEAMRLMILKCRGLGVPGTCRTLPVYVNKLLAAFDNEQPQADEPLSMEQIQIQIQNQKSKTQNLVEPLSERELDVLRLFQSELSGPEIAQELVVALSTIRTHTKNIYSKLNVNSRRAAVKRAAELGLI